MADTTWKASTTAKSTATLASATEFRVVDDPAGTPTSKKTTAGAIKTYINGLANTWAAQQTFAAGTITTSAPTTFTQTWNAGGVTFTGKLTNVTDTASAAASLLEDWQTGGTSMFAIRKDGYIRPYVGIFAQTSTLFIGTSSFAASGQVSLAATGVSQRVDGAYGFSAGNPGTNDIAFMRNAAGIGEITSGTANAYRDLKLRTLFAVGNGTSGPNLNLTVSAAPTSPTDGDVWREDNTNTGLKIRINGVTKTVTVS